MAAAPVLSVLKARWRAVAIGAACFVAAYHALLLVTLVLRFGHWPNYVTLHDWPSNVARIVRSTPAVTDMAPIILDEWLLEVGYINHDYGLGIAEWSLTILPAKLALVTLVALLVSIDLVALHAAAGRCRVGRHPYGAGLAIGTGAALSGFASTTMTWIVCCAAPSWAVTLSMLGVGLHGLVAGAARRLAQWGRLRPADPGQRPPAGRPDAPAGSAHPRTACDQAGPHRLTPGQP